MIYVLARTMSFSIRRSFAYSKVETLHLKSEWERQKEEKKGEWHGCSCRES